MLYYNQEEDCQSLAISSPAINWVRVFRGHNYLKSRLIVDILNFSEITCTLFLTSIFEFLRLQKIMKFMHGGHFEFP